jgi:hypothetical protein
MVTKPPYSNSPFLRTSRIAWTNLLRIPSINSISLRLGLDPGGFSFSETDEIVVYQNPENVTFFTLLLLIFEGQKPEET